MLVACVRVVVVFFFPKHLPKGNLFLCLLYPILSLNYSYQQNLGFADNYNSNLKLDTAITITIISVPFHMIINFKSNFLPTVEVMCSF